MAERPSPPPTTYTPLQLSPQSPGSGTEEETDEDDDDSSDKENEDKMYTNIEPTAEELDENGYLCDDFVVSDNDVEWEDDVSISSDENDLSYFGTMPVTLKRAGDSKQSRDSVNDDEKHSSAPVTPLGHRHRRLRKRLTEQSPPPSPKPMWPSTFTPPPSTRQIPPQRRTNCVYSDTESDSDHDNSSPTQLASPEDPSGTSTIKRKRSLENMSMEREANGDSLRQKKFRRLTETFRT
ncbi:hypothetical protein AAF712_004034 [Marasmius tenuissimus]|uniref:Uncharacterized protein n=1 Tax=Marasmius tenuissimus TaxID=585030 RepID=A0ABR3A7T7_9AGAR